MTTSFDTTDGNDDGVNLAQASALGLDLARDLPGDDVAVDPRVIAQAGREHVYTPDDDGGDVGPRNPFDVIHAITESAVPTVTLAVRAANGRSTRVSVRYRLDFDYSVIEKLTRDSRLKPNRPVGPDNLDPIKLNGLVCAKFCAAILTDGVPYPDPDGGDLTFQSRLSRDSERAKGTVLGAVYSLLDNPNVLAHGDAITVAAGYGSGAEEVDPR